ncbi:MAG: hypothetical protein MUE53_00025 [Chitinophagales bacterium]|jgi:hypothetical protein|nr:hypothetical protein [Chitinophagales bacterium]
MRVFWTFFFLCAFLNIVAQDDLFYKMDKINSETSLDSFVEYVNNSTFLEKNAFLAVATMKKAEYVTMPWSKLKAFNQGKGMLERYITSKPNCIYGRYLRLLSQLKAPKMLNYNQKIQEDKTVLENKIKENKVSKFISQSFSEIISQYKL